MANEFIVRNGIKSLGGVTFPYTAVTSTYTINTENYFVDCTSGTFTVTLPTSSGKTGQIFVIKNSGSGTITLATTGGQTIDGSSTKTLPQYASVTVQSDSATTGTGRTIDYRMVVNSECLNYVLACFRPATYTTEGNALNTLIAPQGAGNFGAYQASWMSQVNSGLPFTFNQSKFFCRNGLNIARLGWRVDENFFEPRTPQEMYIDNLRHWRNYNNGEKTKPHAGMKNIHDFKTCYFTGLLSFEVKSDDDVKSVYNLRGLNTNGKAIAISCQTETTDERFQNQAGNNVDGFSSIEVAPAAGDIPTFVVCTTQTLELQGRRNIDLKY